MKTIASAIFVFLTVANYAQVITGVGAQGGYKGPFERGHQYTTYCGNNPESWVRGSAWLDKFNGLLTMQVQLETDAVHAGPRGQVCAFIYDANGYLLARVASSEMGMGGKPPGGAVIRTFQASFNVGPEIAARANSVVVQSISTGYTFQVFGVTLEQVQDALGLIQQFAMFFVGG